MLSSEQLNTVETLVKELDERQTIWLSGYLSGLHAPAATLSPPPALPTPTATILYGSQSGNGKSIADALAATIQQRRLKVEMFSMNDYKTARLKKEKFLFIIISTHGEGEPPDAATEFYQFLHSARAPKLTTAYSLLALGDSSYEKFCQTGRDIDGRLRELGAVALTELAECDLDFERVAEQWQATAVESLAQATQVSPPRITTIKSQIVLPSSLPLYNRQNPFHAPVLRILPLNPPRHTFHLELSLEESGLNYRPGDSLAIFPENSMGLAQQIAEALSLSWHEEIEIDNQYATVEEWLLRRLDIAQPTLPILSRLSEMNSDLAILAADTTKARAYLSGRNLLDVLNDFPLNQNKAAVLRCLRQLTPRLYSLASSAMAREGEAHLLAARDVYQNFSGMMQLGVCSSYLNRLGENLNHHNEEQTVKVFLQSNENFRLPDDNSAPIIMIGPGAGVAPFRAFVEEREARGADGKNWLFFGERHRRHDFYYQTEWQTHLRRGLLSRMDVAFSRDGHKVYVQDKLRLQQKILWQWLQDGAVIYVCGSIRMAKDVHETLREIIENFGSNGDEQLKNMQETGRYQRDVY